MAVTANGAVARGAIWMLLARLGDRVGGFINIAIAARFLTPHDFGIYQMAFSVIVLVEVFTMFGFEWSLIQHADPKREHFDTAFTMQVIVSTVASVVILSLAIPMAYFYQTPDLVLAISVLACLPFIFGLNNLAVAHLRREMRFEADFWRMFVPRILSFIACIGAAMFWQNYWALIFGLFVAKVASVAMGYVLHPYRPRFSLVARKELWRFSMWMQLTGILEGIRGRSADLVVGRLLGTQSLAMFNLSNELANMPQAELVGGLNSAMFPKYSRLQNDPDQLRAAYLDVFGLVVLACLPIAVGVACVAPAAVMVLLGKNWIDVIPLVQLLSYSALAGAISGNTAFVLMSAGQPKINTVLIAVSTVLLVAMLVLMTKTMGLDGAALAVVLTSWLVLPVHLFVLRRVIGLRLAPLLSRTWRCCIGAGAMAVVVVAVMPPGVPKTFLDALLILTWVAPLGAAVYAVTVAGLWHLSGRPQGIEGLLLVRINEVVDVVKRRLQPVPR